MDEKTLYVRVGENVRHTLGRAAAAMTGLDAGVAVTPHYEIGFENIAQLSAVFTPRRWELLASLREAGPVSISALARLLKRDYKNVHGDVTALMEWMAVEKNEDGLVYAPFADILVDVHLPDRRAA